MLILLMKLLQITNTLSDDTFAVITVTTIDNDEVLQPLSIKNNC